MEWKEWVDKIVFIKLTDGQVFSFSKVLLYDEPFISITDKYGLPAVVNINSILKIREEEHGI
jgi:hypothetical protein